MIVLLYVNSVSFVKCAIQYVLFATHRIMLAILMTILC